MGMNELAASSNAWIRAKIAIVAVAIVLLAAGASTAIILLGRLEPLQGVPRGWSVLGSDEDQWNWADGRIVAHSTNGESILASSKEYRNVTLSAVVGTSDREASLALHMQDADNGYVVIFAPSGTARGDAGHIALVKREYGQETTLGYYHGRVFSYIGPSAKVTVIARSPWIEVHLNDVAVIRVKDTTFESGFIGLRIYGDRDSPCDSTFSHVTFY